MEFLQVFVFIYLMGVVAPVAMCNFTQAAAKIVLETSCVLQLLKRHLLPSGNETWLWKITIYSGCSHYIKMVIFNNYVQLGN